MISYNVMNKNLILILIYFIVAKASAQIETKIKIYGDYKKVSNPCEGIHLKSNGEFEIYNNCDTGDIANYLCCNLISKGDYKFNSTTRILEFNSLKTMKIEELETTIIESNNEQLENEIVLIIDNPITAEDPKSKYLIYHVDLLSPEGSVTKIFDSSRAIIKSIAELETINVKLFLKTSLPIINFGTLQLDLVNTHFNVINPDSNTFIISTPSLNYEFLNFKRLDGELALITKNGSIKWNNEEYETRKN